MIDLRPIRWKCECGVIEITSPYARKVQHEHGGLFFMLMPMSSRKPKTRRKERR